MGKNNPIRGKTKESRELLSTSPRKSNALSGLKTEGMVRGNFHWYSNPVIGYKHLLDPSRKPGSPTSKKSLGKSLKSVSTRNKESYPF